MFLWVVLRKCFLGALSLLGLDDHWNDAKDVPVFLLGPTDPGGSTGFCSLL